MKNTCKHVGDLVAIRRIYDDSERFQKLTEFFKKYQGTRDGNWIDCNICKEHLLCLHERLQIQAYLNPAEKSIIEKEIILKFSGGSFQGKYICRNCGQAIRDLDFDNSLEFDDNGNPKSGRAVLEDEDEILSIFAKMSPEDGIVVKKDKNQIHIKDDNSDSEYLVNLGESEEDMYEYSDSEFNEEDDDMETQNVINRIFGEMDSELGEEMDEPIYEIEMDEEMEEEMEDDIEEMEETIYEIEMEEEEMDEEEMDDIEESYNPKHAKKGEHKEGKMSIKPKGVGLGKGPKTSKMTDNTEGGFDEDMPEGKKSIGTGKAKFSYKEGENLEGKNKVVKKSETKEAARTLGNGKRWGREGLDKPRSAPRHLKVESLEDEVGLLRQKNEEYRKALNVFREKLNEVAVFNSNLAYATRLFTEHSTTKKEKINILRRFDNVENISAYCEDFSVTFNKTNTTTSTNTTPSSTSTTNTTSDTSTSTISQTIPTGQTIISNGTPNV
jgi:hypothetical protein